MSSARKIIGAGLAGLGAWLAIRGNQIQGVQGVTVPSGGQGTVYYVPSSTGPATGPAGGDIPSFTRPKLGAASSPDPTPILGLVRRAEAGPAGYEAISGLVAKHLYPNQPITRLTVGQILQWQEAIDDFQNSEAVGAYQIMEDTLRDLVRLGHASVNSRFNAATQDHLALKLMERRGLFKFFSGELTPDGFADKLAREWAGLPVMRRQAGHFRTVNPGESYYAGFNSNGATVDVQSVRVALNNAKG